jgi:hypothetical protein
MKTDRHATKANAAGPPGLFSVGPKRSLAWLGLWGAVRTELGGLPDDFAVLLAHRRRWPGSATQ